MAKSSKKHQAKIRRPRGLRQSLPVPTKSRRPLAVPAEPAVTAARSRIMRSIRQKHTKPEVLVRKVIHAMGFRFRLHQRDLPGKPDIVMRRHGVIVQIHGCFWHQHGCSISNIPRTRKEYWIPKLARNVERDGIHHSLLTSMGWRVITVWECEASDIATLSKRLRRLLGVKRSF
jgi:DNA mismatch endonuclease (patch repair protein)